MAIVISFVCGFVAFPVVLFLVALGYELDTVNRPEA